MINWNVWQSIVIVTFSQFHSLFKIKAIQARQVFCYIIIFFFIDFVDHFSHFENLYATYAQINPHRLIFKAWKKTLSHVNITRNYHMQLSHINILY